MWKKHFLDERLTNLYDVIPIVPVIFVTTNHYGVFFAEDVILSNVQPHPGVSHWQLQDDYFLSNDQITIIWLFQNAFYRKPQKECKRTICFIRLINLWSVMRSDMQIKIGHVYWKNFMEQSSNFMMKSGLHSWHPLCFFFNDLYTRHRDTINAFRVTFHI